MEITKVSGLGKANTRVITKNNTYIFDRNSDFKRTDVKNNCYIEWVTDKQGKITGIVEVFLSKAFFNGRMEEKILQKFGNVSELL